MRRKTIQLCLCNKFTTIEKLWDLFNIHSHSQILRYLPGPVPILFRAIAKRHAMTGSRLGRYAETRPAPGFQLNQENYILLRE
jgi:hypothetical protein